MNVVRVTTVMRPIAHHRDAVPARREDARRVGGADAVDAWWWCAFVAPAGEDPPRYDG